MWHCHSFKPFWQLYHWIIVVPQFRLRTTAFKTHTTLQDTYNIARPSQKQSRENCRQVELQNHDNWKTVATESKESACVQLHASELQLKQLTSNPKMNIQRTAGLELFPLTTHASFCKTVKTLARFPHSLCRQSSITRQLYCFLGRLMPWKTCTSNNTIQADATTSDAVKFKCLANSCNPTFRTSKADLFTDTWKWDKTTL